MMLDMGSQRKIISQQLVDKIQANNNRIGMYMPHWFGSSWGTNRLYIIVKLKVDKFKDTDKIILEAMVEASILASNHKLRNIPLDNFGLADQKSDIFNFNVLVGVEHFYKVVMPYLESKQLLGLWLTQTVHNKCLLHGIIQVVPQ